MSDTPDIIDIIDRFRIQQLLVDYTMAVDSGRFDELDGIFAADAYLDFREMGGIDGPYPQIKSWLREVLPNFTKYAHMLGLPAIRITSDTATARTFCFNPMTAGRSREDSDPVTMLLGLWYDDELRRTGAETWRITRRVARKCFAQAPTS